MDELFDPKRHQELVLYKAIMRRVQPSVRPPAAGQVPHFHGTGSIGLLELSPDIRRIIDNLQHRVFYSSLWWSATLPEKGLNINTLA